MTQAQAATARGDQPDFAALERALLQELIRRELFLPTGVPGLYGRGAVFEDILARLDAFITAQAQGDGAELVRFPPAIPRDDFERSGYLKSFPHLAGTVFSFEGSPADHAKLLDQVSRGEDWSDSQTMAEMVLTPAACYPIYPVAAAREVPRGGRLFDLYCWCFRHEPSGDPARLQMFRMREFVRVCAPDEAPAWRDHWLERGTRMLRSLGLPVESDVANDPFFGRGGRMLAANQREQKLKFELLVPVVSPARPTAIMSFNYHQDHFGKTFGLRLPDGETAHTACVGFGMERIVLGLLVTHGFDPTSWPAEVRKNLWGA